LSRFFIETKNGPDKEPGPRDGGHQISSSFLPGRSPESLVLDGATSPGKRTEKIVTHGCHLKAGR
jgi:hypothetical protein